ncbi:hypothetical protein Vadar_028739 [Vaccinium darrowii]|uniref:Uncharacterized protein n=1 Tax=Vaccinium darrowii TaxID=229202 RepID=A0ACB7Z6X0_9ERIC|nr:hypothetical protein Vadar_028739 [Vaccinium darrowii]
MLSTSFAPCQWQVFYYPIPNRWKFDDQPLHLFTKGTTPISSPLNCQTHFTNNSFLTLPSTNSCSSDQHRKNPDDKHEFLQDFRSSIDDNSALNKTQKRYSREGKEGREREAEDRSSISTNMRWADFKGALGQSINLEGIVSSVSVLARDRQLALPHVSVPDIRSSMEQCKSVFGDDIAVFSNSAGLLEFDPDGRKARAVEYAIGIKVIRHRVKKPGGTAEEIEKHFGCESSQLIMVGDRPFTDVVFGNRNGFLTILTEPLSLAEEPFIVKQVRKLEVALVNWWSKRGLKPTSHGLLPDAGCCVKDTPPL